MTVLLPKKNFLDKILAWAGKERRVIIPPNIYERYGKYALIQGKFESFWLALFRRKSKD
jgi:hypothetical protein